MNILIDSYNCCAQNKAGGVQSKIFDTFKEIAKQGVNIKLFDKWSDKVENYDLIHFFKLSGEHYSLMKLAKDKGKKVVLSSIVALEGERRIKIGLILGKLHLANPISNGKKQLDMSDVIITETEKEKDFLVKNYKIERNKIIVIPNGISSAVQGGDPDLFKRTYNVTKPFVLQLGRFDRNKNQINVIRALKETDIPVVFIGGADPSEQSYFDLCKSEATENMIFTGWIDHSNPLLSSALAAADVLVLPSYNEIFGNAIFEGISNHCKIVATNVLPIAQWNLGKMVLPINPADVLDIKEKIYESLQMDCNEDIVREVCRDYSFENIAKKHIEVYTELIG